MKPAGWSLCPGRITRLSIRDTGIELGEIEAAASSLAVLEACVCVYDRGREVICLFYQARNPCDKEILRELGEKASQIHASGEAGVYAAASSE